MSQKKDSGTNVPNVPNVSEENVPETTKIIDGTMTPEGIKLQVPANYGQPDCECLHCRAAGGKHKLNHGKYKSADQLSPGEINRVSLPCDVDHIGFLTLANIDKSGRVIAGQDKRTGVQHNQQQP